MRRRLWIVGSPTIWVGFNFGCLDGKPLLFFMWNRKQASAFRQKPLPLATLAPFKFQRSFGMSENTDMDNFSIVDRIHWTGRYLSPHFFQTSNSPDFHFLPTPSPTFMTTEGLIFYLNISSLWKKKSCCAFTHCPGRSHCGYSHSAGEGGVESSLLLRVYHNVITQCFDSLNLTSRCKRKVSVFLLNTDPQQ